MARWIVTTKHGLCAVGLWLVALAVQAGDDGFLWTVRDRAGALRGYLFGTVHLCSAACYPLPESARAAFNASRVLALELDPTDPTIGVALGRAGRVPAELAGLSGRLPAAQWLALVGLARQQGVSPQLLDRMQPWLVSMSLMVSAAGQLGYGPQWGVDVWLATAARATGIELLALETVERQIDALAAGGEAAQLAALAQTIDLLENGRLGDYLDRTIRAWRSGDGPALAKLLELEADEEALAPLLDQVLAQRNHEMAFRIAQLTDAPGPLFVAVGAAHLDGPEGLVAELAKLGFVLERVVDPPVSSQPPSTGRDRLRGEYYR